MRKCQLRLDSAVRKANTLHSPPFTEQKCREPLCRFISTSNRLQRSPGLVVLIVNLIPSRTLTGRNANTLKHFCLLLYQTTETVGTKDIEISPRNLTLGEGEGDSQRGTYLLGRDLVQYKMRLKPKGTSTRGGTML